MAANISVRVVFNHFPQMPPKCRGAAKRGTLKKAEKIVQRARGRAKVDTGFMRASTQARGVSATDAVAEANAPYSIFLDKGTRYIAADYWFSGAADAEAVSYGPEMANEIRSALGG